MQNKTIIVVGGSSGIGLAVCQRLEHNIVYNISRTDCPVSHVHNLNADVTDPAAVERAFARIPRADVMFYCAGTSLAAPVENILTDDYRYLLNVNLCGAVECCKRALPLLKAAHGKIVLLSSVGGVVPIAYDAIYSASKAAINMLARAISLEQSDVQCTAAVINGVRTQFSFKRKVYDVVSPFLEKNFREATKQLIKIEQTGYTAAQTAAELIEISQRKTPPVVYVGAKTKLLIGLYNMLPQCIKRAVERSIYSISD